jgi:hypothetical protein
MMPNCPTCQESFDVTKEPTPGQCWCGHCELLFTTSPRAPATEDSSASEKLTAENATLKAENELMRRDIKRLNYVCAGQNISFRAAIDRAMASENEGQQ